METPGYKKQEKRKVRNVEGGNATAAALIPCPGEGKKHYQIVPRRLSYGERMEKMLAGGEQELKIIRAQADLNKANQATPFLSVDPNSNNSQRQKTIADLCRAAEVQFGTVEEAVWADRVDESSLVNGDTDVRPLVLSYHPDLPGVGIHVDTTEGVEVNLPNELDFNAFEVENVTKEIIEVVTFADEIDDDWVMVCKIYRPDDAKV